MKQQTKNNLTIVFLILLITMFASSVFTDLSEPTSYYIQQIILQ